LFSAYSDPETLSAQQKTMMLKEIHFTDAIVTEV
jgi:hypothetical protein